MQDHEPSQEEFGEDFEADSLEFDMGAGVESPQQESAGMSIANAALAAALAARRTGAVAHLQQNGRRVRRGNQVILFGI